MRRTHSNRRRGNRHQQRKPITTPEPYNSIIERVMAADREYFKRHPWQVHYERPMVYGEFWPYFPGGVLYVIVSQLQPGARTRAAVQGRGGSPWRVTA